MLRSLPPCMTPNTHRCTVLLCAGRARGRAQEGKARGAVQDIMGEMLRGLPPYVWLVALPQLTSRICHPHAETQRFTQHILTRVTQAFPHQARGLPGARRQLCLQMCSASCRTS